MMRTTRDITTAEVVAERERSARAHAERQANLRPEGPMIRALRELRAELGREPSRAEKIARVAANG